jgi:hypothetical protein
MKGKTPPSIIRIWIRTITIAFEDWYRKQYITVREVNLELESGRQRRSRRAN